MGNYSSHNLAPSLGAPFGEYTGSRRSDILQLVHARKEVHRVDDISDRVDAIGPMRDLTGRVLFILPRLRRPTLYPRVSRNSSGITLDSDSQTQELGVVMNPHQGAVTNGLYVTTSLCSRRILVLGPDPENEAERLSRNLGVMNSAMQPTRLSTFTASTLGDILYSFHLPCLEAG